MIVTLLMLGSVLTQGVGIASTRASDGLTRPRWVVVAFVMITISVALMARALERGVSLAVGYGIWSGSGIVLAAASGAVLFGDRLRRTHLVGLALIVVGVVLVHGGTGP